MKPRTREQDTEQQLVDLCFELVIFANEQNKKFSSPAEAAEWVARQLRLCGFPTVMARGVSGRAARQSIFNAARTAGRELRLRNATISFSHQCETLHSRLRNYVEYGDKLGLEWKARTIAEFKRSTDERRRTAEFYKNTNNVFAHPPRLP